MGFSPEFERDVFTAMFRHPNVFADYQDVIPPKTFGVPAYRKLWHIIQEFYREQKEMPTTTTLIDLIATRDDDGFFLDEDLKYILDNFEIIMNGTPVNERYVLDKLISWVKEKRLRSQVSTAVRKIETGEAGIDEVIRLVKDAEVSSEIQRQEEEEDFVSQMMEYVTTKRLQPDGNIITTGLTTLDETLGGGPRRGYKCILFGPPGHGKTTTAVQICGSAVQQGLGAYYLFNDDTEAEMYDRFTSFFSYIPTTELCKDYNEEDLLAVQEKLQRSRGELGLRYIPEFTMPSVVRRLVEKRIESGHPVDVLVIDHLRNMRADEKTDNSWYDIGAIFTGLMGLAIEFNLVLYAVMHTHRSAEGKSYLNNSHIGLSYEPVKDANLILAVWRNKEDFASQGYEDSLRVQITKHRGGPGLGALLRFNADFAKMRIQPAGEVVASDGSYENEEIYDPTTGG